MTRMLGEMASHEPPIDELRSRYPGTQAAKHRNRAPGQAFRRRAAPHRALIERFRAGKSPNLEVDTQNILRRARMQQHLSVNHRVGKPLEKYEQNPLAIS